MKQKHLLYGVIAGLGVLLYFKFGKKKMKELNENQGGASNGTDLGGNTGGVKPSPITPTKNENCGNFTIYYGSVKNDFKWNNGKPTLTKTQLPQYPMAYGGGQMVKASGGTYKNLTVIKDFFAPVTKPITLQEYSKGCADKKSGNFDSPQMGGGAPPVDPILINPVLTTGGIKPPISGSTPIKVPVKYGIYPVEPVAVRASGDLDGDILEEVIN